MLVTRMSLSFIMCDLVIAPVHCGYVLNLSVAHTFWSLGVCCFVSSLWLTLCMLRVVRDLRTGLLPSGGSVLVVGLYGVCIETPLRVGGQPSTNVVAYHVLFIKPAKWLEIPGSVKFIAVYRYL